MVGNMKALLLPVILAAMKGDVEALATVLDHNKGYIRFLAMRPVIDEYLQGT